MCCLTLSFFPFWLWPYERREFLGVLLIRREYVHSYVSPAGAVQCRGSWDRSPALLPPHWWLSGSHFPFLVFGSIMHEILGITTDDVRSFPALNIPHFCDILCIATTHTKEGGILPTERLDKELCICVRERESLYKKCGPECIFKSHPVIAHLLSSKDYFPFVTQSWRQSYLGNAPSAVLKWKPNRRVSKPSRGIAAII